MDMGDGFTNNWVDDGTPTIENLAFSGRIKTWDDDELNILKAHEKFDLFNRAARDYPTHGTGHGPNRGSIVVGMVVVIGLTLAVNFVANYLYPTTPTWATKNHAAVKVVTPPAQDSSTTPAGK